MCARFTLAVPDLVSLGRMLAADVDPTLSALYRPRFNVAPSNVCPIVRGREGRRELAPATWGLVSSWAREGTPAARPRVNARSEGVATSAAFRDALARRRCVVPADGFYEWTGARGARRPVWFSPAAGAGLLHLAGMYEERRRDALYPTFTIFTTAANETVAAVHDRMPAILDADAIDAWLDLDAHPERAAELLRPAQPGLLVPRPVSPRVNAVANDDPTLLREEAPVTQGTLPLFSATRR